MVQKIGLLYGGKSAEHEVSLSTAQAVTGAIHLEKYEVYPIYITLDGQWLVGERLIAPVSNVKQLKLQPQENLSNNLTPFIEAHRMQSFDVVFPLLHGTNGEDGTVQGLLEVLNIAYVGNGVLSSSAGMDKVIMKQLFEVAGLQQVPYVHFIRSKWLVNQQEIIQQCGQNLRYPLFVKPANLGSSVGISKVANAEELVDAIELALQYDRKIIVEQGITAREIEVGVLGNDVVEISVPGEIRPRTAFYDYDSKYSDGSTELIIPANVSTAVIGKLEEMAKSAFAVLDAAGLVRADFFVTAQDEVYINEVNTMPGFTPYSMYPLLWQHTGVAYEVLIDRLIELAQERHTEKQQLRYQKD